MSSVYPNFDEVFEIDKDGSIIDTDYSKVRKYERLFDSKSVYKKAKKNGYSPIQFVFPSAVKDVEIEKENIKEREAFIEAMYKEARNLILEDIPVHSYTLEAQKRYGWDKNDVNIFKQIHGRLAENKDLNIEADKKRTARAMGEMIAESPMGTPGIQEFAVGSKKALLNLGSMFSWLVEKTAELFSDKDRKDTKDTNSFSDKLMQESEILSEASSGARQIRRDAGDLALNESFAQDVEGAVSSGMETVITTLVTTGAGAALSTGKAVVGNIAKQGIKQTVKQGIKQFASKAVSPNTWMFASRDALKNLFAKIGSRTMMDVDISRVTLSSMNQAEHAVKYRDDMSGLDKAAYVLAKGTAEGAITAAFNSLGHGGFEKSFFTAIEKAGSKQVAKSAAKDIMTSSLTKAFKDAGLNLASEIVEESTNTVVGNIVDSVMAGDKEALSKGRLLEDLYHTVIQTSLTMGAFDLMNIPGTYSSMKMDNKYLKDFSGFYGLEPKQIRDLARDSVKDGKSVDEQNAIFNYKVMREFSLSGTGIRKWVNQNKEFAQELIEGGKTSRKSFETINGLYGEPLSVYKFNEEERSSFLKNVETFVKNEQQTEEQSTLDQEAEAYKAGVQEKQNVDITEKSAQAQQAEEIRRQEQTSQEQFTETGETVERPVGKLATSKLPSIEDFDLQNKLESESHKQNIEELIKEEGLTREQATRLAEREAKRNIHARGKDHVSGWDNFNSKNRKESLKKYIETAQRVADSGQPVVLINMDMHNQGGLNKALGKKTSFTEADKHIKAMLDIVRSEVEKSGATGLWGRTGGDEYISVVEGLTREQVKKAIDRSRKLMKEYASGIKTKTGENLSEIPYAKQKNDLTQKGFGVIVGTVDVDSKSSVDELIDEADNDLDNEKEKGVYYESRSEVGEDGVVAFDRQAGRVEEGEGKEAQRFPDEKRTKRSEETVAPSEQAKISPKKGAKGTIVKGEGKNFDLIGEDNVVSGKNIKNILDTKKQPKTTGNSVKYNFEKYSGKNITEDKASLFKSVQVAKSLGINVEVKRVVKKMTSAQGAMARRSDGSYNLSLHRSIVHGPVADLSSFTVKQIKKDMINAVKEKFNDKDNPYHVKEGKRQIDEIKDLSNNEIIELVKKNRIENVLRKYPNIKKEDMEVFVDSHKDKIVTRVTVKDPSYAGKVMKHELGHFDDLIKQSGMIGKKDTAETILRYVTDVKNGLKLEEEVDKYVKDIKDELSNFSFEWREVGDENPSKSFMKYRMSLAELYADGISGYFSDPVMLKEKAPIFFEIIDRLHESSSALKKAFNDVQKIFEGSTDGASIVETRMNEIDVDHKRIIDEMEEEASKNKMSIKKLVYLTKRAFSNKAEAVLNLHKTLNKIDVEGRPWDAYNDSKYSMSRVELYSMDMQKALKYIKEKGVNYKYFSLYLELQRGLNDRGMDGNEKFLGSVINREGAEMALESLKNQVGESGMKVLAEAKKMFSFARNESIKPLVQCCQAFSEDLKQHILDNDDYVTFRVEEYLDKKHGKGNGFKIMQRTGTLKSYGDAYIATTDSDARMISFLLTNEAKLETVRSLEKAGGEIVEVKKNKDGWFDKPENIDQSLITTMENGVVKGYYVSKDIGASFEDSRSAFIKGAEKFLRSITNPQRLAFTKYSPSFIGRNVFKDSFRTMRNVKGLGNPIRMIKLLLESSAAITKSFATGNIDSTTRELYKRGLLVSNPQLQGEISNEELASYMRKKYSSESLDKTKKNLLGKLLNVLSMPSEISEITTKRAAFVHLTEKQSKYGLTDDQINHIVRFHAGSPSFLTKGELTGITNNLLMFSNPAIQGWAGDIEAFRSDPVGVASKHFAYSILPRLAQLTISSGLIVTILKSLGADDEDESVKFFEKMKKIYSKESSYNLDNYIVVPIALTDDDKAVTIKIPQDENQKLVGGVFGEIYKGLIDEDISALDSVQNVTKFIGSNTPSASPVFELVTDVFEYVTGTNPYDAYRRREAIEKHTFNKGGMDSHKAFMKYIWNKNGGASIYKFRKGADGEIKSAIEEWLDVPVIGQTLGAFVSVTNYGDIERANKAIEKAEKERSEEILLYRDIAKRKASGRKITEEEEKMLKSKKGEAYLKSANVMAHGSAIQKNIFFAKSNNEKVSVFLEYKKNDMSEKEKLEWRTEAIRFLTPKIKAIASDTQKNNSKTTQEMIIDINPMIDKTLISFDDLENALVNSYEKKRATRNFGAKLGKLKRWYDSIK